METATNIRITTLAVGQGLGNLIEGYNEFGALVHLSLVDLGCFETRADTAIKSMQYVKQKMQIRSQEEQKLSGKAMTGGYLLDLAVFSHQDEDHWTLFDNLQKSISTSSLRMCYCFKEEIAAEPGGIQCYERKSMPDGIGMVKTHYIARNGNGVSGRYSTGTFRIDGIEGTYSLKEEDNKDETYFCEEICQFKIAGLHDSVSQSIVNFLVQCTKYMGNIEFRNLEMPIRTANLVTCRTSCKTMLNHKMAYPQQCITVENHDEVSTSFSWIEETGTWRSYPTEGKMNLFRWVPLPDNFHYFIADEFTDWANYVSGLQEVRDEKSMLIRYTLFGGELKSRMPAFRTFVDRVMVGTMRTESWQGFFAPLETCFLTNLNYYLICCLERGESVWSKTAEGPDQDDTTFRNYSSAVLLVCVEAANGNFGFLFPGDATTQTLLYLTDESVTNMGGNQVRWNYMTDGAGRPLTARSELFVVPHHGSCRTNRGYRITEGEKPHDEYEIYQEFMQRLEPLRSQVSSGIGGMNDTDSFQHPAYELVEEIEGLPLVPDDERHGIYCWKEKPGGGRTKHGSISDKANYGTAELDTDPDTFVPYYSHHSYVILLNQADGNVLDIVHERLKL